MRDIFLPSVIRQFEEYKMLGERAMEQLTDDQLLWKPNPESNSIATIVGHMQGNMLSRWTDFLTTDGEKEWRDREGEFENTNKNREEMLQRWETGWICLLTALQDLTGDDLEKTIYIRNQGLSVVQAIHRQLTHYASHVGQIVYLGKMLRGNSWESLSIPRGGTPAHNAEKLLRPPGK